MSSCELKNKLEQLQHEQQNLLNVAKNETYISSVITSGSPLTKTQKSIFESIFGTRDIKMFENAHNVFKDGTEEEQIALIESISSMMQNNDQANTKLQMLSLKDQEAKYTAIDLSGDDIKNITNEVSKILQDINIATEDKFSEINQLISAAGSKYKEAMKSILGEEKFNHRINALVERLKHAIFERDQYEYGSKAYEAFNNKVVAIQDKITGRSIINSLDKLAMFKHSSLFPSVYASTISNESLSAGNESDKIKRHINSVVLKNNTVDANFRIGSDSSNETINDIGYELTPLAALFGINKTDIAVELPRYAQNVVRFAALDIMEDIYKVLAFEPSSREFDEIWGLDKSSSNYDEMRLAAVEKHMTGELPQAVVLTSLGKTIYRGLPVQFAKNIDAEVEQRAIAQLGMYALQYMHNIKFIEKKGEFKINDDKKSHNTIRVNNGTIESDGLYKQEDIATLAAEFQHLGVNEGRNAPRPVGDKYDVSQTIRNSFLPTPESVRKNLEAYESTQFSFNDHAKTLYDLYMTSGKDAAYAMAGVLDVDKSKPVIDQMKEMSKINYAKMQVDAFIRAYDEFGHNGEKFTLPYDYTVSGRYMINSIFNPQESKITRFFVTTKDIDSVLHVENGVINKGDLDLFKTGLAQSFDLDPDKTSDVEAHKELEKIVSVSETGDVTFKDGIFKRAYDVLSREGFADNLSDADKDILMQVNRKGSGFHTIQALMALKQLSDAKKSGNGRLQSNVKLSFSMESDAITSGMILTLLQIGTEKALRLASKGGVYTTEQLKYWEGMYDIYKKSGGQIDALKSDGDGFKITHGWLKAFVADFKKLNPKDAPKFTDFYETVAETANEEMKSIVSKKKKEIDEIKEGLSKVQESRKSNKSEELFKLENQLKRELKNAVLSASLGSVIGNVSRKLAKPPVMVYIYGAMMSSIKVKMLDAIVMPKMYEIFGETSKVISMMNSGKDVTFPELLDFLYHNDEGRPSAQQIMSAYIKESKGLDQKEANIQAFSQIQLMKALIESGNKFEFQKAEGSMFVKDKDQLVKNMIIPDRAAKKLSLATNEVLGKAFEKGFAEFGEIDQYRESVKTAEVVRFTMFKYKLKQGLDKIINRMSDGSYKVSMRDISKVINDLEKSGFGHSVNDINGGKQPLYKKDDLEKAIRTRIAMFQQNGTKESPFGETTAAIEGKEFAPNTGASGVITIHNIDGFIDAVSASAFDLVRIYDGSVSGINKMDESVEAYNQTVLNILSWSSYNTQINDLVKQIQVLKENDEFDDMLSKMQKHDKEALINTIEKLMGYGDLNDEEFDAEHRVETQKALTKARTEDYIKQRQNGNRELQVMHSYLTDSAKLVKGNMPSGELNKIDDGAIDAVYDMYLSIITELQNHKIGGSNTPNNPESSQKSSSKITMGSMIEHEESVALGDNFKGSDSAYANINKTRAEKIKSQMDGKIQIGKVNYNIDAIDIVDGNVRIRISDKEHGIKTYSFPFGSSTSLPTKSGKTVTTSYLHLYTDKLKYMPTSNGRTYKQSVAKLSEALGGIMSIEEAMDIADKYENKDC